MKIFFEDLKNPEILKTIPHHPVYPNILALGSHIETFDPSFWKGCQASEQRGYHEPRPPKRIVGMRAYNGISFGF